MDAVGATAYTAVPIRAPVSVAAPAAMSAAVVSIPEWSPANFERSRVITFHSMHPHLSNIRARVTLRRPKCAVLSPSLSFVV